MKKGRLNHSLASLLGMGGLLEAVSGFILWFGIPRGTPNAYTTAEFWGLVRSQWLVVHDWGGVFITVLAVIHFAVHWRWWLRLTATLLGFKQPRVPEQEMVAVPVRARIDRQR